VQEKTKLERDQRASLSLAKRGGFDGSTATSGGSSSADHYKRKVSELNVHVQKLNATLAEKDRELQSMTRQLERNMSQNRLANLRRGGGTEKHPY